MTKQPTARQLADDLVTLLEWHDVYAPRLAAELRRVHNVGVPLASALVQGYVHSLTMSGRRHLEDSLIDVAKAHEVASTDPVRWNASPFPLFWDAVRRTGEYTEWDVPAMLAEVGQTATRLVAAERTLAAFRDARS